MPAARYAGNSGWALRGPAPCRRQRVTADKDAQPMAVPSAHHAPACCRIGRGWPPPPPQRCGAPPPPWPAAARWPPVWRSAGPSQPGEEAASASWARAHPQPCPCGGVQGTPRSPAPPAPAARSPAHRLTRGPRSGLGSPCGTPAGEPGSAPHREPLWPPAPRTHPCMSRKQRMHSSDFLSVENMM